MIGAISGVAGYLGNWISNVDVADIESSARSVLGWLEDAYDTLLGSESDGGLAACTPQSSTAANSGEQSGVHFYVKGDAVDNWGKAADQVLRFYCGVTEPTDRKNWSGSVALALKAANEQHLDRDSDIINYDSKTPAGVDHRLMAFWRSDAEIFIPTPTPVEICPNRSQEAVEPPVSVEPEIVEPDAVADAGAADAEVADAGVPRPQPRPPRPPRPRPTPSQPDAGPTKPPPTTTPTVTPELPPI